MKYWNGYEINPLRNAKMNNKSPCTAGAFLFGGSTVHTYSLLKQRIRAIAWEASQDERVAIMAISYISLIGLRVPRLAVYCDDLCIEIAEVHEEVTLYV